MSSSLCPLDAPEEKVKCWKFGRMFGSGQPAWPAPSNRADTENRNIFLNYKYLARTAWTEQATG